LEESDLDLLTQELAGVKQKWYAIGMDLQLEGKVNEIHRQYSDPGVCLRELLTRMQQNRYTTATWRNIVDALRSRDVGESQLADRLEAKYCPSEFINNILLYLNTMQYITLEVVVYWC